MFYAIVKPGGKYAPGYTATVYEFDSALKRNRFVRGQHMQGVTGAYPVPKENTIVRAWLAARSATEPVQMSLCI